MKIFNLNKISNMQWTLLFVILVYSVVLGAANDVYRITNFKDASHNSNRQNLLVAPVTIGEFIPLHICFSGTVASWDMVWRDYKINVKATVYPAKILNNGDDPGANVRFVKEDLTAYVVETHEQLVGPDAGKKTIKKYTSKNFGFYGDTEGAVFKFLLRGDFSGIVGKFAVVGEGGPMAAPSPIPSCN